MDLLILFAKYPQASQVKTRLGKDLGDEKSAEIYRGLVEQIVAQTQPAAKDYQRALFFDPPDRAGDFQKWFPIIEHQFPQEGVSLGDRLKNAFESSLKGRASRVVVVGSDCPYVDQSLIQRSFRSLDFHDLVLGPASDGGYYLIGLKKLYYPLFQHISWSTGKVLSQTEDRALSLNLKIHRLPTLSDIDTLQDYQSWQKLA